MRYLRVYAAATVLAVATAPGLVSAAPVCTPNDPVTSFGANYWNNVETPVVPQACGAGSTTTAARLVNTSYGRSVITAPNTGDYKFLRKGFGTSSSQPPLIALLISSQNDMLNFPDPGIQQPAVGAGCDEAVAGGTGGVNAIERSLHRSWPLFGTTYYFGDYNANPPNDPASVTAVTSPFLKWTPFAMGRTYTSAQFRSAPTSSTPGPSGGHYPSPLPLVGSAGDSACDASGLTAAEAAQCKVCIAARGYYLKDRTLPGDLGQSVFKGEILNDYPPSWVHGAWAYGFLENFTLADASGNPVFRMSHISLSTQTSSCGQSNNQMISGANPVPPCNKVWPNYDWDFIKAANGWQVNQQAGEGQQQNWASYGGPGKGNTPAADLLSAGDSLLKMYKTGGCSNCQSMAVISIGFGIPCGEPRPSSLPVQTMAPCTGDCDYTAPVGTYCPGCAAQPHNYLAEAAHYLYNTKGVRSYFIGMGPHTGAMRRAAAEGHGKYIDARNAVDFHDGFIGALLELTSIATATTTSTINAVQVNVSGQEQLTPRFVSSASSGIWEGHLYKYYLFSEFAGNCTKAGDTVAVPNSIQPICTATCICAGGSCNSTWLVDSTCKLIAGDATGFLYQATWNGSTLVPGSIPAVPVWDAAAMLQSKPWYRRTVYTAIDSNGDGKINSKDGMLDVTKEADPGAVDLSGGVSDAVADALSPYMGIDGTTTCAEIEALLGTSLPGGWANRTRACARVILNYALGEDLLNENFLSSLDPQYRTLNRVSMLGDIFHSSPQRLGPPASEADCGMDTRRCVTTLFAGKDYPATDFQQLEKPAQVVDPATGATVANPGTVDAYEAFYRHVTFGLRAPHVAFYGANDGMVHATQTACFATTYTLNGTIYPAYFEGPGNSGCAVGGSAANGAELWAFIPPDLLPKLGRMLLGEHQIFADSTAMVRDIYASTASPATPLKRYTTGNPDTMDFKTIAVMGEREGGTRWFAFDVTDPTNPNFLWIFPQPNTREELAVGFSYGEWAPNAPPIVPVRVAAPVGIGGYPVYRDSTNLNQPFIEKWVVMLPGGYDPYGVVGKNLWVLDALTGTTVYRFGSSGSIHVDYPFAALPAGVAWGANATESSPNYNGGFTDTIIAGDLGGQVWTIRLNDVGQNMPVTNWFGGRAFRQSKAEDPAVYNGTYVMRHRNPIFQMAAVARMPTGPMRAFVGTGDRANAAEDSVGECSVYNPLACGKRQCRMVIATNTSTGGAGPSGYSSFAGDTAATYSSTTTWTSPMPNVCSPNASVLNACADCTPAPGTRAATDLSPAEPQYACTNSAGGWQCYVKPISGSDPNDRLETTSQTMVPDPATDIGYYSRFLAFNVFGTGARAPFTSAMTAAAYDAAALTETDLKNLFPNPPYTFLPKSTPVLADAVTGNDRGFYFSYPVIDERTAANSVLLQSCVSWYTIQPGAPCNTNADCESNLCNTTTHTCDDPIICGASGNAISARTAFLYQINAVTGSSTCGLTSTTGLRSAAATNAFVLPPPPAQELVAINSSGRIQFGLVTPAGQLSPPPSTSGGGNTPLNFLYTIEAPRELHQCRHVGDPNACY